MTYREMAIETIKIACQDTLDRVEEIVPDIDCITDIDVVIHIPTLTDDAAVIPEIKIMTNAYIRRVAAEKIFDMLTKDGACKQPEETTQVPHLDRDGCVYWDSVLVKGEAEEE